jgi:hypothetical protein
MTACLGADALINAVFSIYNTADADTKPPIELRFQRDANLLAYQ